MIKVLYSFEDEHYTYLSVKGHSNYAEAGSDLVCAGASSIVFGLLNALDKTRGIEIKEKNNHIEVYNQSNLQKIDNYFELVLFQLKTIEESYGEFIKVERK